MPPIFFPLYIYIYRFFKQLTKIRRTRWAGRQSHIMSDDLVSNTVYNRYLHTATFVHRQIHMLVTDVCQRRRLTGPLHNLHSLIPELQINFINHTCFQIKTCQKGHQIKSRFSIYIAHVPVSDDLSTVYDL